MTFFGLNITPTIDAGHVVIAVSILSGWLASIRKRVQAEATTPIRLTNLEVQNMMIIKQLDLITAEQSDIKDKVVDNNHQARNTRAIARAVYKDIHNGKSKSDRELVNDAQQEKQNASETA